MSNKAQNPNDKKKYDLEERTAQFGEAIIELVRTFPQDPVNSPLISQLVRAATSIGANYMEADGAESKKDFNTKSLSAKKRRRRQSIGLK
jgi:four helix bundle protein